MQIKNYYCNDEIDRQTCPLCYNEKNATYKIGRHKVPTLEEVVTDMTKILSPSFPERDKIMSHLHYFLLTATIGEPVADIAEEIKPYAGNLKHYLTEKGYYKIDTPPLVKKEFTYNKTKKPKDTQIIKEYLSILEAEKELKYCNPHYFLEIEALEEYFHNLKNKNRFNGEAEEEDINWFNDFEKVNQFHYHLAKKRSIRENFYFVSKIDIATANTLYYIVPEMDFNTTFATLYLNMQNIDLKKDNLAVLKLNIDKTITEIPIKKMTDEILNKSIEAYKKRNCRIILEEIKDIDTPKEYTKFFNAQKYISKLFDKNDKANLEQFFSFLLQILFPEEYKITPGQDIKELKLFIVDIVIYAIQTFERIAREYSVEYALIYLNELGEWLNNELTKNDLDEIKRLIKVDVVKHFVTETLKDLIPKLAKVIKEEEEQLAGSGFQEMKYQYITLNLYLTEKQKESLYNYLNTNLITSRFNKNEEEEGNNMGDNKGDNKMDGMEQIAGIKERKKISTLDNHSVNLIDLYKKEINYYGCTQSSMYIHCKIEDVKILYKDSKEEGISIIILEVKLRKIGSTKKFSTWFSIFPKKNIDSLDYTEKEKAQIKEERKQTNERLTLFFDTFSIKRGDFNTSSWIGKDGIIAIKESPILEIEKGFRHKLGIPEPKEAEDKNGFLTECGKGVFFVEENSYRYYKAFN